MKSYSFATVLAFCIVLPVYKASAQKSSSGSTNESGGVLPESVAWKSITTVSSNSSESSIIEIAAVHNGRWRIEDKAVQTNSSSRTPVVAVFDGAHFASNRRRATADSLDPRIIMRKLVSSSHKARPVATEMCDGRLCWRYGGSFLDFGSDVAMPVPELKTAQLWVDTKTLFPVCYDGVTADGTHTIVRYFLVQLDLVGGGARYFNTNSMYPLFSRLLVP